MEREQIIEYVKEIMLSYPEIDADFTYRVSTIALVDDGMFRLLNNWMETVDEEERMMLEQQMLDAIDDFNLVGRTNLL